MKLLIQQLEQESQKGFDQQGWLPAFKCVSFEYMLAGISGEYFKFEGFKSMSEFNKYNRLTINQAMAYPFFVALSNGYSKSLFNLFGEFYTAPFGPASISLFDLTNFPPENLTRERPLKYLNLNSDKNKIGIEVLNIEENISFEIIKNKIKAEQIDILGNKNVPFGEVIIENDDQSESKPLFQAIDNGICIIQEKFKGNFFTPQGNNIMNMATLFDAFSNAYKSNKSSILTYDAIKKDKRKAFHFAG